MNILGLGGSIHDYSACLVRDGEVRCMMEEERLARVKHCLGLGGKVFRCRAADYCLQAEGLDAGSLDLVVGNDLIDPVYYMKYADSIQLINHHLAHAASGFYPSSFPNAAVLVADGRGSFTGFPAERETVTYYFGNGSELSEIKKVSGTDTLDFGAAHDSESGLTDADMSNSVGGFYERVTTEIGFGLLQEGKTMGLSPYGTAQHTDAFGSFYSMDDEGNFRQTLDQVKELRMYIRRTLEAAEDPEKFQAKADLAYAVQHHMERILVKACRYLYNATGSRNLCLAGGVFLNSVANYEILRQTPFEHIFVQPAAGDAGTAIGSALYGYHVLGGRPRTEVNIPFSPYQGKSYGPDECAKAAGAFADRIERVEAADVSMKTAELLAEGHIVGWFQGRSEIGPRALGNRSILADPRQAAMKDTINARIKHREHFRPFAPAVLEERQADFFDLGCPSYYMLLVPSFLPGKGEEAAAVCHEDRTGRVQTVSRGLNPRFHELLVHFESLTGTPVLLNTSFNDNGEPIVETPHDAVSCFLRIDLDYLVLNGTIYKKRKEGGAGREKSGEPPSGHACSEAWPS
ncbi:carbamoyltransferase family protein [Paenibacillus chitinolyticus]|uniref:carbamoyltransferase family protein n=1 Tax=Paenibacillus chitinolyticus TaxID=79263 RepID=UPI00366D7C8C